MRQDRFELIEYIKKANPLIPQKFWDIARFNYTEKIVVDDWTELMKIPEGEYFNPYFPIAKWENILEPLSNQCWAYVVERVHQLTEKVITARNVLNQMNVEGAYLKIHESWKDPLTRGVNIPVVSESIESNRLKIQSVPVSFLGMKLIFGEPAMILSHKTFARYVPVFPELWDRSTETAEIPVLRSEEGK